MLLAIKAMLLTAFTVILTTVLYALFGSIINEVFEWLQGYINDASSNMPALVYQFVGLGAWLYDHLRIAESLALIFSGVVISFTLRLVRIKK